MNKLTVVLPAYNEEENLETLYRRWEEQRDLLSDEFNLILHVVVVDDGSSDSTSEIAERIENNNDCFTLIRHGKNKGLGGAIRTGIKHFLEKNQDSPYMCIMDCDNTQDPIYISDMLKAINDKAVDVVIASRYREGSKVDGVTKWRLMMSGGAKLVFSNLLMVPGVKDYTCGYRLYGREKLKDTSERFKDKLIEENGFTCMVELLYKLYSCGAKFVEIPFLLRYDKKKGNSKMSVMKTAVNSIILAKKLRKIGSSEDEQVGDCCRE